MRFALLVLPMIALPCYANEYGKSLLGRGEDTAVQTSLIALLGNPSEWNGRAVSVVGFIAPDLHGVLLYVSSELCESGAEQYSVQVVLDAIEPRIEWHDLPGKRCQLAEVHGQFLNQSDAFSPPESGADSSSSDVVIGRFVMRDRPGLIEAQYVGYDR